MKTQNPYIHLKNSGIHNYGLYAKTRISEDTPIIQYTGRRLTQKQADRHAEKNAGACIYLFELDKKAVLDGDTPDNIAKYINHSCEPNCYTDISDGEIWIYALRDIQPGEELSYDYGFPRSGWQEHPCLCGTEDCFGFIVSREHHNAIRKTQRYQKWLQSQLATLT
jgi:SET domain-containing protein